MVRDLTGRRFGHLTASREVGSDPDGRGRLWECRCDCGTVKTLPAQRLPKTISCGCQKARGLRAFNEAARAFYAAGEWDCSRCGRHLMADQFSPTYTDRGHPASRRTVCKLCESVRKYGLNAKTWQELLDSQGGTCASCREASDRWCVDHDHGCCPGIRSCGECVRGILCNGCNTAEGLLGTAEKARRLANYMDCKSVGGTPPQ